MFLHAVPVSLSYIVASLHILLLKGDTPARANALPFAEPETSTCEDAVDDSDMHELDLHMAALSRVELLQTSFSLQHPGNAQHSENSHAQSMLQRLLSSQHPLQGLSTHLGLNDGRRLLDVVSWAGTICAVLLFASPAPTFSNIVREGAVRNFDALPYLLALLQCLLWVSYAVITPNRLPSLLTNLCGAGFELIWCMLYFVYTSDRAKFGKQFIVVVAVWMVLTGVDVLTVPHIQMWHRHRLKPEDSIQTEALGLICVVFNILMYAAPLGIAKRVIQTGSVEYMPLGLSICTLLCSSTWTAYSLMVNDIWLLIPNFSGVVLGVAQLFIYFWFRGGAQPDLKG